MDQIITHLDGSKTGYNDYGGNGYAVIICHGGPGSRIISKNIVEQATLDGLRLIGIGWWYLLLNIYTMVYYNIWYTNNKTVNV